MWKKIKYKKILYSLSLSVLFSPAIVRAQTRDVPYTNPSEYDNLGQIVQSIAEFLAYIAFPLAAIMIIYTGIKFLLARGNEQKVTEAKETFRWVVIGTAIVIGAYAIVLTLRTIF